jgi:hypothetical protein
MEAQDKAKKLLFGVVLVGFMVYSYLANQPTGEPVKKIEQDSAVDPVIKEEYQTASLSGSGQMPTQYMNGIVQDTYAPNLAPMANSDDTHTLVESGGMVIDGSHATELS